MSPLRRAERWMFEPQSTSPMALVRVAWGVTAASWAVTLLPDVDPFLTEGALRSHRPSPAGSWNPLEWISWSGAPLASCVLLVVAGLATALGWRTRLASATAALCMLALQRTNTAVFNSGDLLLRQIGIAVALAPCGLRWSLDARQARRRHGVAAAPWRAPWALRLLQLQVATGYLLSAWAKLRGDTWRDGTAVARALRIEDLQRFVAPEWLFEQSVVLNLLTWATLAFEGTLLFLVWNRRLRPWVLGLGVAFHLGIDLAFDVGFFSLAIWVAYLAFVPPDVADRLLARVKRADGSGGDAAPDPVGLAVEPAE